jgi:hypothetical protein
MSKINYPLFAISKCTPDYTNIDILDVDTEAEARAEYEEEKEDRDEDENFALFKINGPGSIYLGSEAAGEGNVECLEDTVWDD